MKKIHTLVICFFMSIAFFGQKDTLSIPLDYKAKSYNKKESLAISNDRTGEMVILVEDSKTTNLYLFDENGQKKGELNTKRLKTKFKNFVGHHYYEDGSYAIVFSNTPQETNLKALGVSLSMKYGALKFNFKTNKVEQIALDFKLKKERYVECITQNNTFYIMTAAKGSSDNVHFYELNPNNVFDKHVVSFESICYNSKFGMRKRPIDIFTKRYFSNGSLAKIDPNSPNSIATTASENKLYQIKNQFLFTFDNDENTTNILKVNLSDFTTENMKFQQPIMLAKENEGEYNTSHNSYINNGLIYQLKVSWKQMRVIVSDFQNKKIIKEFEVKKEDKIPFKNGPIIQEKEGDVLLGKERKLEKTAKFLRKVAASHAGITSIKVDDDLQLTIGGYIERKSSGDVIGNNGGFGTIGVSSVSSFSHSYNPTFTAYNQYSSTKITYINCLLDKEFNHLQGEVQDNIFDIIKVYEKDFDYNERVVKQKANGSKYVKPARMKLKNVFYHNGNHYLGYLNTIDRNYHLVKF